MSAFLEPIARAFSDALLPIRTGFSSPEEFEAFMFRYGWEVSVAEGELNVINTAFALEPLLVTLRDNLDQLVNGTNTDRLAALAKLLRAAKSAGDLIRNLTPSTMAGLAAPFNQQSFWSEFSTHLMDDLLATYLERRQPVLFSLLHMSGIISYEKTMPSGPNRIPFTRTRLVWERLPSLFTDPNDLFNDLYKWNAPGLTFRHRSFLQALERSLHAFGIPATLGLPSETLAKTYLNPSLIISQTIRELQAPLVEATNTIDDAWVRLGFIVLPVADPVGSDNDPTGLLISPILQADVSSTIPIAQSIGLKVSAGVDANTIFIIKLYPQKVALETSLTDTRVHFFIELSGKPIDPYLLIGSTDSHWVKLDGFKALFGIDGPITDPEILLGVGTGEGDSKLRLRINLASNEGDSFIQNLAGEQDLLVEVGANLLWSSKRGVSFEGSAALDFIKHLHVALGPVSIEKIHVHAGANSNGLDVDLGVSLKGNLGPVVAIVEDIGVRASLVPVGTGASGAFGTLDVKFNFKPPKGAALSIDAGVVVGGGFLFFDTDTQQYGGMIHLEIAESLNLNAIGLITTRLPDGSPGFSMLVLIAVEFAPPIQLGYGFALKGIGGILGINRTVAVDVLRSGLRAGTLGSILLPHDPIANAPKIISDLNAVFPPSEGRFVFGPMILLGWGPNNLIQLQIGLVLELPAPARLFILGRLRVFLPDEEHPVVKLQLDALGVIDFGNGDISLDAVLYDSEIKGFVITGEMALRANVGATPGFVLAVGGFHPAFPAPAGFPALKRVTISLATGDTPRLRLAAYLALTTNTVQFGASLDFLLQIAWFSVEGRFAFDALIQFTPFGLAASMAAMVAVKAGTTVLLAVQLDLSLTGPTPWHIWGKAHFQILFISVTVDFDATIGQEQPPPLPPPVDIRPLLLAALKDPRNWGTELPLGERPMVVLREAQQAQTEMPQGTPPPPLLVHPLANLHVSQQVVPFDREVTKFGNTISEGERQFTLLVRNVENHWIGPKPEGSSTEGPVWLVDRFAPAQFRTMSDDEQLRAPAFEEYRSGIRLSLVGYECGIPVVEDSIAYEESATVGPVGLVAVPLTPYMLTAVFVRQTATVGAVGQAALHHSGRSKYRQEFLKPPTKQGITIKPRTFEIFERDGVASPVPSRTKGESFSAKLESVNKPRGDLRWKKPRTRVMPKLATVENE